MQFASTLSFVFLLCSSVAAADFGYALLDCLGSVALCKEGDKCSNDATPKQVECYEQIGLSRTQCKFRKDEVTCPSSFVVKLLPDTKGCQLEISRSKSRGIVYAVIKKEENSLDGCYLHGFRLEQSDYIAVHDAVKKNGKWRHEFPKMSVGFEKVLAPKDTVIKSIGGSGKYETSVPPWIWFTEGNRKSPNYTCGHTLDSLKYVSDRLGPEFLKNRLKFFGYQDVPAAAGQKHFGGDGRNDTSVVWSFSSPLEFKLCGKTIPKGTEIQYDYFRLATCVAVTPGAVSVLLPASLFSEAKGLPKDFSSAEVRCAPKAQRLSSFDKLTKDAVSSKKPIVIPKLDWQDCDCEYNDPDEQIR